MLCTLDRSKGGEWSLRPERNVYQDANVKNVFYILMRRNDNLKLPRSWRREEKYKR